MLTDTKKPGSPGFFVLGIGVDLEHRGCVFGFRIDIMGVRQLEWSAATVNWRSKPLNGLDESLKYHYFATPLAHSGRYGIKSATQEISHSVLVGEGNNIWPALADQITQFNISAYHSMNTLRVLSAFSAMGIGRLAPDAPISYDRNRATIAR